MITDKEQEVINASIELWDKFLDLPKEAEGEKELFREHIFAIQNIILIRSARRILKEHEEIPNTKKLMDRLRISLIGY